MFKELVNKFVSEGIPFLVIPQTKENTIRISTEKANIIITSPETAFIDINIDAYPFEMLIDSKFDSMPRVLTETRCICKLYEDYDDAKLLLNDYFSII